MALDFGKLLHGGDYNPEQWLHEPGVLKEDLGLMKQAHINCVTLGVFSWAVLEPQEGVYQTDWLEKIIEELYKEGILTILATPSGAMPHWLTQKYPEVLQTQENGVQNRPGRRHNFCYTSPVYREKTGAINRMLSKRLGSHPGVILWHISNELGGNFSDGACYCEQCSQAFREWLKEKYKTLEALNQAWWATFWSHTYTDWSQIQPPAPNAEPLLHGLNLDWKRFVTHQMTDYVKEEIKALKTQSTLPVTTNYMDFFKNLDYFKLSGELDLVSFDSYPYWHKQKDETPVAVRAAANLTLMRSIKRKTFLLMESTPSLVNWRPNNSPKRPGMHLLSSIQAIAHGSDSVQYFQWRKGRGSFEKFHGAVLDHKGGGNTRVFEDVKQVGSVLGGLSPIVLDSINKPRAALIFDWENWWAIEDASGPLLELHYPELFLQHYAPFWKAGVDVDILDMDQDFSGYSLLAAPYLYLYRAGFAEKVRSFVKQGGVFVTTCFSGVVNETDLCFTGSHPLQEVLGLEVEELDAPSEEFENHFLWKGVEYPAGRLQEIVALRGAKSLAEYREDYCRGKAVLTCNGFGKGQAYYLAVQGNDEFLGEFYRDILEKTGIHNPLGIELPYGVTLSVRTREDGGQIVFLQNFNAVEKQITLQKNQMQSWREWSLSDEKAVLLAEPVINLCPYSVRFLLDFF